MKNHSNDQLDTVALLSVRNTSLSSLSSVFYYCCWDHQADDVIGVTASGLIGVADRVDTVGVEKTISSPPNRCCGSSNSFDAIPSPSDEYVVWISVDVVDEDGGSGVKGGISP